MNNPSSKYADRPNLVRLAQEIQSHEDPERTLEALAVLLSRRSGEDGEAQTNIDRLTQRINSCKHPRRVLNALATLAPVIREGRERSKGDAV